MQYNFYKILLDKTLFLYNQYKEKQINQIIFLNNNLLNINAKTFMYNGKWYSINSQRHSKTDNKKLHYSLIPKIEKILNQDFKELEFKAIMQNFCSNIIYNITNINELQKLIPNELFKLISYTAKNYFKLYKEQIGISNDLTEKQFKKLQIACKPGLIELAKLRIIKSFNL